MSSRNGCVGNELDARPPLSLQSGPDYLGDGPRLAIHPFLSMHIHGSFDVTVTPQSPVDGVGDPAIGRMALDKRFYGDLEATSKGQMLASMSPSVKGSAGYVAMERVDGTLLGKRGSFVLQHSSFMNRSVPEQNITVVPDTGTDELVGLSGSMTITVVEKKHFYDFEFALDATPSTNG